MNYFFLYKYRENVDLFINYLVDKVYCKVKRNRFEVVELITKDNDKIILNCHSEADFKDDKLRGYRVNGIFIEDNIKIDDCLYYQLLSVITPYNLFGFDIRKLSFNNGKVEYY